MQLAEFRADLGENVRDLFVSGDIARQNEGILPERAGEFFDVLFEPFALVRERKLRPGAMPGLSDGPGDGPLVRHAEDNAELTSKKRHKEPPPKLLKRYKVKSLKRLNGLNLIAACGQFYDCSVGLREIEITRAFAPAAAFNLFGALRQPDAAFRF